MFESFQQGPPDPMFFLKRRQIKTHHQRKPISVLVSIETKVATTASFRLLHRYAPVKAGLSSANLPGGFQAKLLLAENDPGHDVSFCQVHETLRNCSITNGVV